LKICIIRDSTKVTHNKDSKDNNLTACKLAIKLLCKDNLFFKSYI
jgi:hypothetical protein